MLFFVYRVVVIVYEKRLFRVKIKTLPNSWWGDVGKAKNLDHRTTWSSDRDNDRCF